MGMFNAIKAYLTSNEAEKAIVPTYHMCAPVMVQTVRGEQSFINYSTKTQSVGMLKLYGKGLAKDEAEFVKNFVFKYVQPWEKNPMAILNPVKEGVVRTYLKMEDARFYEDNEKIRKALKEAYGLHITDPAEKKIWLRENAGLYKKMFISFKGTFTLKKENDNTLAYVGDVSEVLDFGIITDTREQPVFRAHPLSVVDPTQADAAWFERFQVHPNRDVNLDIVQQAQKMSKEMGITDLQIEGF